MFENEELLQGHNLHNHNHAKVEAETIKADSILKYIHTADISGMRWLIKAAASPVGEGIGVKERERKSLFGKRESKGTLKDSERILAEWRVGIKPSGSMGMKALSRDSKTNIKSKRKTAFIL